jgi:methyltransferase (TIGR00027 family)
MAPEPHDVSREGEDPLRDVSDTALWVAMYRAAESERPDAHFRDPYARRLAGARGERILRTMARGRTSSWAMVVRTALIDEVVLRVVRDEGIDTVLNLAAGLDTRPWRLELPAALRWVDADLPAMIGYKSREMARVTPSCRYETRAVDLRLEAERRTLFDEIGSTAKRALVVSEGLLVYLEASAVADLARDLAAQPSFRHWLIDIVSPAVLKRINQQWGRRLAERNAPLIFAPAEGTKFFAPLGWREREFRSFWDESARLKREIPYAWFWRFLVRLSPPERQRKFRRFSGVVLMERG